MTESENPGITTEQQINAQYKPYPQANSSGKDDRGAKRGENKIRKKTDRLM